MRYRQYVLLALVALTAGGCRMGSGQAGSGGWRGLTLTRRGDPWVIECLAARDEGRVANADRLAALLKKQSRIDGRLVEVVHGDEASTIYYMQEHRPGYEEDSAVPRFEEAAHATVKQIRGLSLRVAGQVVHPFLHARLVPAPTPDVGPSEWDLRNAEGAYSLQICYCINKPGFPDRKKLAVEIVKQLRSEGEEAYYYHGPSCSLVCVGSFPASAVVTRMVAQPDGTERALPFYTEAVKRLQHKRESFKYNSENLQKVYKVIEGKRHPQTSFLVPIPRRGGDALP